MKVGDYIRDKRGMIAKIKKFWIYHNVTFIITDKDTISESIVVKSSPNIIDLIEVGDYVNGWKVEDLDDIWHYDLDGCCPVPDEIKSIVTREMFESMEYKIGE